MANPEHLEILKQGVEVWNEWLTTFDDEEPDFSDDAPPPFFADLREANLREANLREANLREANLREASLCKANLSEADLSDADLSDANLCGATLRGAILVGAKLHHTNLAGANLDGTKLAGADLYGANLSGGLYGSSATLIGADLSGAELAGAILGSATLAGANLSGVGLRSANLSFTDLSGTNLSGADLLWAIFARTHLKDTDLAKAKIDNTIFRSVDLSGAIGLETCIYGGQSVVDHTTLERSRQLPDAFLQGVGFSDIYIKYIPIIFGGGTEFYSAFLSHNSQDKTFVRRLHDSLQGHGVRCWLDEKQLLPGDDIYDEIDHGIRLWDKLILVCSETSLQSWWVEHEWKKAMDKEQRLRKERGEKVLAIIPVDIDGFIHSDECKVSVKSEILSRKVADFTGWKDHDAFESALEGLVSALRADEGRKAPLPEGKL